jgi:dTDP-4-dehydrorhamnose 3,5-epimerase
MKPIIENQTIPGLLKITLPAYIDERGELMEVFNELTFPVPGFSIKQINHVVSDKHSLRGLHYQIKYPQAKLLQLVSGNIFDVCVDLRTNSRTFGKWIGFHLQYDNEALFIPHGIAHGFYSIETSTVIYYMDNSYRPEYERVLLWNDSMLSIKWPLISKEPVILSYRDQIAPTFEEADKFYPQTKLGCMWYQLPFDLEGTSNELPNNQ